MNHYDDLQRFKDKTRSQLENYKDLSAQSSAEERGDWALINQLSPTRQEPDLAMGGHVSSPVPKTVAAHVFSSPHVSPLQASASDHAAPQPHTLPPLMQSVARLSPASPQPSQSEAVTATPAAPSSVSIAKTFASPPPPVAEPVARPLSPVDHPQPVANAPVPQPEPPKAPPVARPAVVTPPPESVNYSRLFAPKTAEPPAPDEKTNEEKALPLKSLLERIASCR
ncbi:cellulose biosynthesis protein BcsO [Superficieibacter electus]|uniref:Cellulose biosynthesis protein BcsO n=1 Tax=Superficieibacter electus TaxID=2022662 RepID=A0A2P5GPM1_9ENTR|nr:cellulose biosynthesis protein BcsO [Superficieibacter electus]POP45238.1 cellulose biosynthesis protein BcsO [Superficieibacter electus]POP48522.1 cellulose biosynthesis protein BcsO [Superficieibacter electus]